MLALEILAGLEKFAKVVDGFECELEEISKKEGQVSVEGSRAKEANSRHDATPASLSVCIFNIVSRLQMQCSSIALTRMLVELSLLLKSTPPSMSCRLSPLHTIPSYC
jgi:hypothetical protein